MASFLLRALAPAALAAALAAPGAAPAQDGAEAGPLLTFGLSERLDAGFNPLLGAGGDGAGLVSTTALSFGYQDSTPRDRFELGLSTSLRLSTEGDAAVAAPRLTLGYARLGASSSLRLNGSLRQDDVSYLRALDLLDPDGDGTGDGTGGSDDPDDGTGGDGIIDLSDLVGEGTRRDASASAQLALGEEGPLGLTLSARLAATRYGDGASDTLRDSTRSRLATLLRLRLSPVLDGTVGLSYAVVEREAGGGEPATRLATRGLDLGFSLDRPAGPLRLDLGLADADAGTRVSLRLGRTLELPRGALSFALGATRRAGGGLTLVGDLSLSRELSRAGATLDLRARRSVATTTEGETVVTRLSAAYAQPLTNRLGLSLDAAWATTDADADGVSQVAEAEARLSLALTRDWSLGTGVSYALRDPASGPAEKDASLFLSLGRSFSVRP